MSSVVVVVYLVERFYGVGQFYELLAKRWGRVRLYG